MIISSRENTSNDGTRMTSFSRMNQFVQHSNQQGNDYSLEQMMEEAPLIFDRFGEMDPQKDLDSLGVPFPPPVRWVADSDEEATAGLDNFEDSLQGIYYDGPELDPYILGEPTLACVNEEQVDEPTGAVSFEYPLVANGTKEPLLLTNSPVHSETSVLQKQFQRECCLEDTTENTEDLTETTDSPDFPFHENPHEDCWLNIQPSLDDVYERVEVISNESEILNHSATSPKTTKRKQKACQSNKRQRKERTTKVPASSEVVLTDIDVLAGRGGGSNNHIGNASYWIKVMELRDEYKAVHVRDYVEKTRIASIVMDFVHGYGGRSVRKHSETQTYHEMSEMETLEKIRQALRDKYEPQFFTA